MELPPVVAADGRAARAAFPGAGWIQALVLVAAGKVVTAILLAATGAVSTPRAPIFLAHILVYGLTGAWLLVFGRLDRRAVCLGLMLLLVAVTFSDPMLALAHPGPGLEPVRALLAPVQVDAFNPFLLYGFVSAFPSSSFNAWRGRLFGTAQTLAFAAALVLVAANLVVGWGGPPRAAGIDLTLFLRFNRKGLYWPIVFSLTVPALVYAARRSRSATIDEARRVRVILAGLVVAAAPVTIVTLLSSVPLLGPWLRSARGVGALGWIVYPAMLSLPFSTAYAVLVQHALDLRGIVRTGLRYALARRTLVAMCIAPFVVMLAVLYVNRTLPVDRLIAGPAGLALGATAAAGLAALRWHEPLRDALDRRFFREEYDARQILSALMAAVSGLENATELEPVLRRGIDRALHVRAVRLLTFPVRGVPGPGRMHGDTLDLGDALMQRLRTAPTPLDVDWERPPDWVEALPEIARARLVDLDARLLVPLSTPVGDLLGLLVIGAKLSELPFSAEDRMLLVAIAASVTLFLRGHVAEPSDSEFAGSDDSRLGRECPRCGRVWPAASDVCDHCGSGCRPALLPALISEKFVVSRRLGQGGMGVVYLATDRSLEREVALKTLPRVSAQEAARLRREARAMAAVAHPNLAAIFGAETWRGLPILVVEYLAGGTLEERLRARGPLHFAEVVHLGCSLARALARLHSAGVLHRDIKPSNIGFGREDTPKLLDFGLAQVVRPAQAPDLLPGGMRDLSPGSGDSRAAGTLLYLSPESLRGRSPDASWDLWALAIVLWEALAAKHPLEGVAPRWAALRIAEADLPDIRDLRPDVPPPLAAFLAGALAADVRRRPATAQAFFRRLRSIDVAARQPAA